MDDRLRERRKADPLMAQRIWDALLDCQKNKKVANIGKLVQFCVKTYDMEKVKVEEQISLLLEDGLIVGENGDRPEDVLVLASMTFRIPNVTEIDLSTDHDWYCFSCHKPGKVLDCTMCHRVYHPDCAPSETDNTEPFVCPICKDLQIVSDLKFRVKPLERGELYVIACNKMEYQAKEHIDIKKWTPSLAMVTSAQNLTDRGVALQRRREKRKEPGAEVNDAGDDAQSWRKRMLLHRPLTIEDMTRRSDVLFYKSMKQFLADCASVVHSVAVFFGAHSPAADRARVMYRDCQQDLKDMEACRFCYRRSSDLAFQKDDTDWFTIPCRPPHPIVFAKQRGFPYWPAKILQEVDGKYDVRYFGGKKHERGFVEKNCVLPIETDVATFKMQKTHTKWNEALRELRLYQQRLTDPPAQVPTNSDDSSDDDGDGDDGEPASKVAKMDEDGDGSDLNDQVNRILDTLDESGLREDPSAPVQNLDPCQVVLNRMPSERQPIVVDDQRVKLLSPENDSLQQQIVELKKQLEDKTKNEDRRIGERDVLVAAKDKLIASNVRLLAEKDALVNERDKQLAKKEELLQEANRKLKESIRLIAEKDDQLTGKEILVVEREVQIVDKNSLIAEKDQQILQQNQLMLEKNQQIDDLTAKVDRLRQELHEAKTRRWCAVCLKEARLNCCVASYCSRDCQRIHWATEHRKVCIRNVQRESQASKE